MTNEKIEEKKQIDVEPTFIVSKGITKFLVCIMVLMAFLTLNIVGKLDTMTLDKIESTTTINYTQNYKDLTYDYPNDIMYLQRLENIGKSFEIFGKNTIWFTQINKYASENGKITTTIQFIGNILLLPVNLIINVFQLGTNVVNSAIGNEKFNAWNLRYYGELTPETVHKWEQFSKYLPWNWFN